MTSTSPQNQSLHARSRSTSATPILSHQQHAIHGEPPRHENNIHEFMPPGNEQSHTISHESPLSTRTSRKSPFTYLTGLFLLSLVILIWVLSSQAIQLIFQSFNYSKPFFLTYYSTMMFSIYIPILGIRHLVKMLISWMYGNNQQQERTTTLEHPQSSRNSSMVQSDYHSRAPNTYQALHQEDMETDATETLDGVHENKTLNGKSKSSASDGPVQEANLLSLPEEDGGATDDPSLSPAHRLNSSTHQEEEAESSLSSPLEAVPTISHSYDASHFSNRWKRRLSYSTILPTSEHDMSYPAIPASSRVLLYFLVSAGILAPFWIWTNFAFNASLKITSVSANTIISNTSSAFCFLSGIVIGVDRFSFTRALSILVAMSGVVFISLLDKSESESTFYGDFLAALSAFSYGCYTSVLSFLMDPPEEADTKLPNSDEELKHSQHTALPEERKSYGGLHHEVNLAHAERGALSTDSTLSPTRANSVLEDHPHKSNARTPILDMSSTTKMMLLFGLIGVVNTLTTWPFLVLAHVTGLETFEMIPSWRVFFALTLNALIGTVLSDLLWAMAVLLTSPIISTLALCLTIPLAMLTDVLLGKKELSLGFVVGAFLVLLGFIMANVSYYYPKRIKELDSPSFLRVKKTLYTRYWGKILNSETSLPGVSEELDDESGL